MRYKYSQNLTEASEMTFAENEYQGIEQNGTMKRIPTTKIKQAIDDAIEPINTELSGRLDTLEGTGEGSVAKAIGDLAGAGRTTETVKANADDIISIKGTGYTEGSLKTHEDRLDTLEGTGEGSVAKAIDDALEPIENDITDHEERIAQNESDIGTLEGVVDTNRLYSDSQYLDLKAKYDAQQIALNASKAELYTDDPILQYGATEIIGKGYEADDTPIDVSANVVDGKLSMEQKGLTITNLVSNGNFSLGKLGTYATNGTTTLVSKVLSAVGDGSATNIQLNIAWGTGYYLPANLPAGTQIHITARVKTNGSASSAYLQFRDIEGGLVHTIASIPIDDNYHVISGKIVTTAITVKPFIRILANYADNATQTTGSVAFDGNYGVSAYNLTSLGLSTITDTAILAKMFPYVDGTKNVGKLGVQILDADDNVTQTIFLPSIGNSLPNGVADSIKTVADGWEHTKRVESGALSAEKVVNGGFDGITGWSASGATIESGVAKIASGGYLFQDISRVIPVGALCKIAYDVITTNSTGRLTLSGGASSAFNIYNLSITLGHHEYYAIRGAGTTLIIISNTGFAGDIDNVSIKEIATTAGAPLAISVQTQVWDDGTNGYYQLANPITTHYDLPHLTSGKTIHRFAGEEKIALYGTGLTFSENVLSVLSAVKFVAGVMTDITSLATITTNTVTFSGVNATDVVYVKVEHDVDRQLGILEHTPAVSNTASRLASLEARVSALEG